MKKALVKKEKFVRMIYDGACVQLDCEYLKVQFDCGHTVMRRCSPMEKAFFESIVMEASVAEIKEGKDGKHGKN